MISRVTLRRTAVSSTSSTPAQHALMHAVSRIDENGNHVMKQWWDVTDEDIKKMTDATVWCEAGFDNFRGGGFSSHFVTRAEMPATMIRLNLVKGLGPVLQIAEGWTVNLPDEVSDIARGSARTIHGPAHGLLLAAYRQGGQPVHRAHTTL